MSRITNDGLTRSGTGCIIAVPVWQLWASKGWVKFCTKSNNRFYIATNIALFYTQWMWCCAAGFRAYIPQKQKSSFDSVLSSSKPVSDHSDIDSISAVKDHQWKPTTTTATAATTATGNKLVSQPRYNYGNKNSSCRKCIAPPRVQSI